MSDALLAAERLELVQENLADAARAYDALSKSDNLALRATALTRLARVQRKRGAPAAALDAYDRLSRLPPVTVDGYTAALVARVGRVSVFDAAHDATKLRAEAGAFDDDLRAGRLAVTESQYRFYRSETARWLGSAGVPDDPDAVTRARAVGWLWQHQADLVAPQRRLVIFDTGTALILSKALPGADRLLAVVIGPSALQAMVRTAVPPGPRWALVDLEGRLAAGDAPPARQVVTRTSAATLLPWTLHLFPEPDAPDVFVSPRRTRLLSILATVAGVLVAGWFFIWRGISREIRAARLQSDFVAAVSHEFRTPLTSLRYIAELLAADRLPSEERRRQSYALLERETDRLTRLVEGLLEFGRFHAGAPALRFENIDLADLNPVRRQRMP